MSKRCVACRLHTLAFNNGSDADAPTAITRADLRGSRLDAAHRQEHVPEVAPREDLSFGVSGFAESVCRPPIRRFGGVEIGGLPVPVKMAQGERQPEIAGPGTDQGLEDAGTLIPQACLECRRVKAIGGVVVVGRVRQPLVAGREPIGVRRSVGRGCSSRRCRRIQQTQSNRHGRDTTRREHVDQPMRHCLPGSSPGPKVHVGLLSPVTLSSTSNVPNMARRDVNSSVGSRNSAWALPSIGPGSRSDVD